jgi:hypothetical protein
MLTGFVAAPPAQGLLPDDLGPQGDLFPATDNSNIGVSDNEDKADNGTSFGNATVAEPAPLTEHFAHASLSGSLILPPRPQRYSRRKKTAPALSNSKLQDQAAKGAANPAPPLPETGSIPCLHSQHGRNHHAGNVLHLPDSRWNAFTVSVFPSNTFIYANLCPESELHAS